MLNVTERKPAVRSHVAAMTTQNKLQGLGPYFEEGSPKPSLLKIYDRPICYKEGEEAQANYLAAPLHHQDDVCTRHDPFPLWSKQIKRWSADAEWPYWTLWVESRRHVPKLIPQGVPQLDVQAPVREWPSFALQGTTRQRMAEADAAHRYYLSREGPVAIRLGIRRTADQKAPSQTRADSMRPEDGMSDNSSCLPRPNPRPVGQQRRQATQKERRERAHRISRATSMRNSVRDEPPVRFVDYPINDARSWHLRSKSTRLAVSLSDMTSGLISNVPEYH